MKKILATIFATALSLALVAAHDSGFSVDAYNRCFSASVRNDVVFSPISFEFDCVIISEAFDAVTRAKFAEKMSIRNSLENVYRPIYDALVRKEGRNFSFLSAQAYCLPTERKVNSAYRKWMQDAFSAEAFAIAFQQGAECWFRARMEGEMEGFSIPKKAAQEGCYTYFDLASIRCSWQEPFPTNDSRDINFTLSDGSTKTVAAMCDLRPADVWERRNHTILRLPMSDEMWFFAMLPKPGTEVRDIRSELTSNKLPNILAGMTSITELGITHDPIALVIPKMDVSTRADLKQAFAYFKMPLDDMERMEKDIHPRFVSQCVRFRLDEQGCGMPVGEKPADRIVRARADTKRLVLNRPFIFFVYHEPTASMLVLGQFMGQQ